MGRNRKTIEKRPPTKIVAIAPKIYEPSAVTSTTQLQPNDSAKSSGSNSFLLTPKDTTICMNKQTSPKHIETESLLYSCNECDFLFASNASLASHIRMMHPVVSKSDKNPNSKPNASKVNPSADTIISKRVIKLSNKSLANICRTIKIGKQAGERTDDASKIRTFKIVKQAEERTDNASENSAKRDRRMITLKCGTTITVTVNDKEVVKPIASTPRLIQNPFKYGSHSRKIKLVKTIDTAKAVEITPIITSSKSLCTERSTRKSGRLKNIRSKDSPRLRNILPKPIINEPDKGDFDVQFEANDFSNVIFADEDTAASDDDQNNDEESSVDPLGNIKVEIKDETIEVEDVFNQDINAGYENEQESSTETTSSSSYSQLLGGQAPNGNTVNLPNANTINPPNVNTQSLPEILETSPAIRNHLKYLSLMKKQPKILPRLSTGGHKEPQSVQNIPSTLPPPVPILPAPEPVPSFPSPVSAIYVQEPPAPRKPVFVNDPEEQFESEPEDSGLDKRQLKMLKLRKKRVKVEFKRLQLLKFRLYRGTRLVGKESHINNYVRNYGGKLNNFSIKKGKLFFTKDDKELEMVLYWKDMQSAMEKFHTSRGEGHHLSIDETVNLISQVLHWRELKTDVARYVRNCKGCVTPICRKKREVVSQSERFERWSKRMHVYKYRLENGKWPAKIYSNQTKYLHMYKVEGGKLMIKLEMKTTSGRKGWIQVIYSSLEDIKYIISEMHKSDSTDAIHLSNQSTARRVGKKYYWKCWRTDVHDFVAGCSTCYPLDNYCDEDGFFDDTALNNSSEADTIPSFTPGNNWDAETKAAIAGICDDIQPKKVKRGGLITKSTKSGRVVNEELKEKMDEISDATEQRFCKLDSHMARLRRLNVDRKRAEAVKHFLDTGEWTKSVRECVQARLQNQLNNKEIKIENGVLKRMVKGDINDYRIVLTDIHSIQVVMRKYHKSHNGAKLTRDAIRTMYYWREMTEDVIDYVKCCSVCKQKSLMKWNRPEVEKPTELKVMPSERIGKIDVELNLDFAGPFAYTMNGNSFICIISDNWSKFSRFFGQRDVDSVSTADSVVSWIFQNGPPKKISTGQSDSFNEALLQEVQSKLRIIPENCSMGIVYAHQVVENFQATLLNNEELDLQSQHWDQFLEEASYCFNTREKPGKDQDSSAEPSPLYMRHFVQLNNVSKIKINQREEDPFYKRSTSLDFTEPIIPSHSTTQETSIGENIEETSTRENIEDASTRENIEETSTRENIEETSTRENIEETSTRENIVENLDFKCQVQSTSATGKRKRGSSKMTKASPEKKLNPNLQTEEVSKERTSADNEEICKSLLQRTKDILSRSSRKRKKEEMTAEKQQHQGMSSVKRLKSNLETEEATQEHEEELIVNAAEKQYNHNQPIEDKTQTNQCKDPEAKINKPMTAWLKKNLPKLAEDGRNMFQSMELPMIMSRQEYKQMIAKEQQGQSMTAEIQQNQQAEEGTNEKKSDEEIGEDIFLRASKIEGKVNKPMTAWLQNIFDSIKQPTEPLSAEKQQKHRAMSYLMKQDQQGPVKIQPKQPFAGGMQKARQGLVKIQPKQPMTANVQQNQPMKAVMQQGQPMAAVIQQHQPMTSVMQQSQPITSVMQQRQPMTAVMQQCQPITAVMQQGQPMTSVMQHGQPMTSVIQQYQPMTAVMHQKQVAVMGSFIPVVSQPIRVQSGQPVYRSIQQLPVVGQLSRPIVQASTLHSTAASSVNRQQPTASVGQRQQRAVYPSQPQPNPPAAGVKSIRPGVDFHPYISYN